MFYSMSLMSNPKTKDMIIPFFGCILLCFILLYFMCMCIFSLMYLYVCNFVYVLFYVFVYVLFLFPVICNTNERDEFFVCIALLVCFCSCKCTCLRRDCSRRVFVHKLMLRLRRYHLFMSFHVVILLIELIKNKNKQD